MLTMQFLVGASRKKDPAIVLTISKQRQLSNNDRFIGFLDEKLKYLALWFRILVPGTTTTYLSREV